MQVPSDHPGFCQQTSGDIPPKLVGASTTIIGANVYLFGGCRPGSDQVYSRMYICDLNAFKWEKVDFAPDNVPEFGRCFHSAEAWNDQLVIFGGFGSASAPHTSEDPCLLNDVQIFDTVSRRWLQPKSLNGGLTDLIDVPQPRHSHLSSIAADRLFIIGGEDSSSNWLDDIFVYDLREKAWVQQWHFPRSCESYLNVAACAELYVHIPSEGPRVSPASPASLLSPLKTSRSSSPTSPTPSPLSLTSTYLETRTLPDAPAPNSLSHLPYSAKPTDDFPCDIYVYSNYNSMNVKRKLEVFAPPLSSDFTIRDKSPYLSGTPSPPLLRFPSAGIIGTHLVVAGTVLGHSSQFFSIWALDLLNMSWSHVDIGSEVAYGSWFSGQIWRESNQWIMFGDRNAGATGDHNQRLSSWTHIAIIDLEGYGIYQPPPLELDMTTQELCLTALEESVETDFEFICDDGQRIRCSRKLVEGRWPWFGAQMSRLLEKARLALEIIPGSAGKIQKGRSSPPDDKALDPRITSRSFNIGATHAVTLALLQYFYTLSLLTHLQQRPAVLCQLLVISNTYDLPHLKTLVKHAMHLSLSDATCDEFYEAARRCDCHGLKARAFRHVLSYRQRGATPLPMHVRVKREHVSNNSITRIPEVAQPMSSLHTALVTFQHPSSEPVSSPAELYDMAVPPEENRPQTVQALVEIVQGTTLNEQSPTPSTSSSGFAPLQQEDKKQKKSGKILKMFRPSQRSPTNAKPTEGKPEPKRWKTGGGGRHPVSSSAAARAQRIQAIEAAATGFIPPSASEASSTGPAHMGNDRPGPPSDRSPSSGHAGSSSDSFHVVDIPTVNIQGPIEEPSSPLARHHLLRSPDVQPFPKGDVAQPPSYFPGPNHYLMSPLPGNQKTTTKQMYRAHPTDQDYF